ncbi:MAG TPA: RES domain-containing protein [Balneolaceae bacterium]|nr:RES domain-containing protein [Balneolaceae bacterium]
MIVYRFGREKFIKDLSGTGAKIYGGRWNQKGTNLLYSSEHCSLALLELLVHASFNLLPKDIYLLKLSIPETIPLDVIEQNDLPDDWRNYPAPESLAAMGSHWADEQNTVGLKVPSVLTPDESNILLNPNHPAFKRIKIESVSPFSLDLRFYSNP